MDSIRVLILQKVFKQCAKMLDPNPFNKNQPAPERTPENENPVSPGPYDYDVPDPQSEYSRLFKGVFQEARHVTRAGNDEPAIRDSRFDFGLLEPVDQEKAVITKHIRYLSFGTQNLVDINKQNLLPALFLEAGSNAQRQDFRGIELAKEGEVMPIVLRIWTKEPRPSELKGPAYKYSNPLFIAQMREQLDYLLDRNEFISISIPRIGYSLSSQVHDACITSAYTMQGVRAPYECVDFRFEVLFDKQKEIDDRYIT